MSTRGTYLFTDKSEYPSEPDTCIYVHCDNYPEGAVIKLDAMSRCVGGKTCGHNAGLATRFICGNPEAAEITKSHEWHGDTEYRYTITVRQGNVRTGCDYTIKVENRKGYTEPVEASEGRDNWELVGVYTLAEMIEQYGERLDKKNGGWIQS